MQDGLMCGGRRSLSILLRMYTILFSAQALIQSNPLQNRVALRIY